MDCAVASRLGISGECEAPGVKIEGRKGAGVAFGVEARCFRGSTFESARVSRVLATSTEQPILQRVLRWQWVLRDVPTAYVRLCWIMASIIICTQTRGLTNGHGTVAPAFVRNEFTSSLLISH